MPSAELREKVELAGELLAGASELRITSPYGTDVTYRLAGKSILTEYGYTVTPGRWDHWPGGFLATLAADGGVEGRVVMDRGDLLFIHRSRVSKPRPGAQLRGREHARRPP